MMIMILMVIMIVIMMIFVDTCNDFAYNDTCNYSNNDDNNIWGHLHWIRNTIMSLLVLAEIYEI